MLAAGIDVISTVNVQHLESLNDAIAELTDVRVRETFPDRVLEEADEVVLVDLTPEALQERLRAGKVYSRERVDVALDNFFRTDRLSGAARARAARGGRGRRCAAPGGRARSAQRAGRGRAGARARHAGAALAADPAARLALRRAARRPARRALGAPRPAMSSSTEEQVQLAALRRLAVVLGAHFLEEEGDDLVDTVRRVVGERGSTYVFVGTPDESRRREILRGSLVSALVRELPGVDIRVVANRADREERHDPLDALTCSSRPLPVRSYRAAPRRTPGKAPHPRAVLRRARPDRARRGDPDRAGRGGGARAGLPARRAARSTRRTRR